MGIAPAVHELFAAQALVLDIRHRQFVFRYRSPEHWIEVFKIVYGPMVKAFAALDAERQAALTLDLRALVHRHNRAHDRSMVVPADYLEVLITRR